LKVEEGARKKEALPGSIYYLRIAQNVSGRVVSGYTIVIKIVE